MDVGASETWWSVVTGPRELITDTLSSLVDGDSVILSVPESVPWEAEFWYQMSESLKEMPGLENVDVETVDVDCIDDDFEPVEWLLKEFALRVVKLGYRTGTDGVEYLFENDVLKDRIVRIEGRNEEKLREWISLCSRWPKSSGETGLFIVVNHQVTEDEPSVGNLRHISYCEHISSYSVQLFNGLCLERGVSAVLNDQRKRYLASAMWHLCGTDVEVAERMASELNTPPFDPVSAYKSAVDNIGRPGAVPPSENQLLTRSIWEAQAETIFPIVQRRHLAIVDRLRAQIQTSLDQHVIKGSNNERITEPDDTEPGTLVYLYTARGSDGNCLMSVSDQELRDEIYLLKECRNDLAHRRPCSEDKIRLLLG